MNSVILYILFPIILGIIINIIIFVFKLNKNKYTVNPLLPPGYVIGLIWTIIFGLLGYTFYLLLKKNNKLDLSCYAIIFILIFCLLYPFLTNGFSNKNISIILNLLTLLIAIIGTIIVFNQSKYISLFMIPLIIWATYVNIITIFFDK
jgi:tryptophan-rich sensory protein